jgi:hypothetical protein
MKQAEVDQFEKLIVQLVGFHEELSVLVRKSPNDGVNKFKLSFINDVLRQFNVLLGPEYRPFPNFELFSEDDLPSTSDVSFILTQYIECAEIFKADNIMNHFGNWYWVLDDGDRGPSTRPPKTLRNK